MPFTPEQKRIYRQQNKKLISNQRKVWEKTGRDKRNEYLDAYKSDRGCMLCPENHPAALDLHHRDRSQKKFTIADREHQSWRDVLLEIEKCDVICANCHRKLHWNERRPGSGTAIRGMKHNGR